jgi:hypothetical protein
MDLTEGSETSAKLNLTLGKYPKENIQVLDSTFLVPIPTLKRQNPLLSYVRERERGERKKVDWKCSVQYTLLLLYLMLVMSYLSIKLYRIYVCYTNITLYIAFGIMRGFT